LSLQKKRKNRTGSIPNGVFGNNNVGGGPPSPAAVFLSMLDQETTGTLSLQKKRKNRTGLIPGARGRKTFTGRLIAPHQFHHLGGVFGMDEGPAERLRL
jgi:hypothetical protein